MENKADHLVKMIMKNGHVIGLYADDQTLGELVSHPKFLRMRDDANDVFLSIEDVSAFEILSNRKEPPKQAEKNESQQPEAQSAQQA